MRSHPVNFSERFSGARSRLGLFSAWTVTILRTEARTLHGHRSLFEDVPEGSQTTVETQGGRLDFYPLTLPAGISYGRVHALARSEIVRAEPGAVRVVCGADWLMRWFVNGAEVFSTFETGGNGAIPPGLLDHDFLLPLQAGPNQVEVVVTSGEKGFALFADAAPTDLDEIRTRRLEEKEAARRVRRQCLDRPAMVQVDAAAILPAFVRPERYHCLRLTDASVGAVDAAERFFGHARIVRVFGLMRGDFFPGNMHVLADEAERRTRIARLARYADEFLVPVPHRNVRDFLTGQISRQAYLDLAVAALGELAGHLGSPLHIEVFNESEVGDEELDLTDYLRCYWVWVEAVRRLRTAFPNRRFSVGGPSPCSFNSKRIEGLIDAVSGDPSSLDFVSWHQYLFDAEDRPAIAAGELFRVREWLRSRGFSAELPCYVDENGVFPTTQHGPSLRDDLLTQATGVLALHQEYQEAGGQILPFHWTWAHANPRKNLFVPTRESLLYLGQLLGIDVTQSLQTLADHLATEDHALTPYGHAVRLQALLASNRLACDAAPRDEGGIGLRAIAAGDHGRLTLLVWNYQWIDYAAGLAARPGVRIRHATRWLGAGPARVRRHTLDRTHGNFLGGTPEPLVEEHAVAPDATGQLVLDLHVPVNTVILLEITSEDPPA